MTRNQAIQIIEQLALGIDPLNGTFFASDHPIQHHLYIRAFFVILAELKSRPNNKNPRPSNAGKPWLQEEDNCLTRQFNKGVSVRELANQHERSKIGIQKRLIKLNILEDAPPF